MATKKLIERNLKFDNKYIYLGIVRGSIIDGQSSICDNCGAIIANMVTVADKETGKKHTIGTDCAETLSQAKCLYNNGTKTDYNTDLYTINQLVRFVTEVKAGCVIDNDGFTCHLTSRKNKKMCVFTHDMQKYFPSYIN